MINDRDLGELPRIPPDLIVSERHRAHAQAVRDLAGDLVIGVILGIALFCAAVIASWWIA